MQLIRSCILLTFTLKFRCFLPLDAASADEASLCSHASLSRARSLSVAHVETLMRTVYERGSRSRRYTVVQYCSVAALVLLLGGAVVLRVCSELIWH